MRINSQQDGHIENDDNVLNVSSDRYFNKSDGFVQDLEQAGFNVRPVDVFGAFVPQDKSLGNLKKAQQSIRSRFNLEVPEDR